MLEKTLEIETRVEREAEERLLQHLFETAGAGGRATRGRPSAQSWPERGTTHGITPGRHQRSGLRGRGRRAPETQRNRRGRAAQVRLYGKGCEDITIEFPGAGFVVRNTGTHRVRVGIQILSDWDCGRWTRFKLHPGESKHYLSGGYCCPYEAEHY